MARQLSVVLIGCGSNMRFAHVPRIQADGAVRIAAVADPVESQARLLEEKAGRGIPHFHDWRTMLDAVKADGALISTPHDQHYAQARACLENDMHVLVEKPLVIRPLHAKRLLALADQRQRALVVAYQRHWMPHFAYARELIDKGELGEIRGVVAYVTQDWLGMGGWRLRPSASGGGMFADTGSHVVGAVLWLTGLRPRSVLATFDNAGREVDVNSGAVVGFAGGAVGTFATLGNASRHDERIAIAGSRGSLVLRMHGWRLRSMLLNDEPVEPSKRVQPSTPDAAFFRAMRQRRRIFEAPEFAVQVARLTDAAYRSAASGQTVRLR